MQTVLCQRPPTVSNLFRGRNCCTTHVVCKGYRYVLGTHDCISLVEQPQNECQLIDILHSLLVAWIYRRRGRHRCNAVIPACLQLTRGLWLRQIWTCASVRPEDALVSLGPFFLFIFFLITFPVVFFLFFWSTAPPKALPAQNVFRKRLYLSDKLRLAVIIRKKQGFWSLFFWSIRLGLRTTGTVLPILLLKALLKLSM